MGQGLLRLPGGRLVLVNGVVGHGEPAEGEPRLVQAVREVLAAVEGIDQATAHVDGDVAIFRGPADPSRRPGCVAAPPLAAWEDADQREDGDLEVHRPADDHRPVRGHDSEVGAGRRFGRCERGEGAGQGADQDVSGSRSHHGPPLERIWAGTTVAGRSACSSTTGDAPLLPHRRPSSISRTRSPGVMKRRSWVTITSVFPTAPQEPDDLLAAGPVEVAGRLVGEDEHRVPDQRPGHRHALLLSARELVRGGGSGGRPCPTCLRRSSALARRSGVTPSGM